MKKVRVKYESHIFQYDNVERFNEETDGELNDSLNEVKITCLLNSQEGKEKTIFVFKDDSISIIRPNYTLNLEMDKQIEFATKTQYGNIIFTAKLKKYLKLEKQFVLNYELLLDNESIGSYVIKISYEEMN